MSNARIQITECMFSHLGSNEHLSRYNMNTAKVNTNIITIVTQILTTKWGYSLCLFKSRSRLDLRKYLFTQEIVDSRNFNLDLVAAPNLSQF